MQLLRSIAISFFLTLISLSALSQAQVLGVDFFMKYDTTNCWYDCHVIISEGSATFAPYRTQFNANYTVVVPTGSAVAIEENYLPLVDNQGYAGDIPMTWNKGQAAINVNGTGVDYHPISPSLSPSAQYNDINELDTLKLFSISVSNINQCGTGVRFFQNGIDPNANGADYSCGFTIGGPWQDFTGVNTVAYPPKPDIPMPYVNTDNGIEIDLDVVPNSCQVALSCVWTGPNDYNSSNEDVVIDPASSADYGMFKVVVEDELQCKDSMEIMVAEPMASGVDPVTLSNLKWSPTFENIGVHVNIEGDDNKNSTLMIEYRLAGTDTYFPGAITMRASPEMIVNGAALDMNFHAGSALHLLPNSAYNMRVTLTDADGGSEVVEHTVSTKAFPKPNVGGEVKFVIPGNGGGDGTIGNPYRGLQAAADNVAPGDILEVGDGQYDSFALTTSGTESLPITIRSANLHGAVINGGDTNTGIVTIGTANDSIGYIILDGFEIKNGTWGIDAQNTQYVTVKNNKINDVDFGFYNRRENGWEHNQYLTNNEIIGRTSWPQLNGAIPGERGIDIRGDVNVISHNSISDFGDGISTDGPASQVSYALDIHDNYITRVVDDIIEVDGTISNTRVYKNKGLNGRMGISVAPVYGGPAYIFRNELYNLETSAFKMNNQTAGLIILNNSIAKENRGLTSAEGWQNTIFKNNVVLSSHYVLEEYGLVAGSNDAWSSNAYLSLRAGTAAQPWFKWDNVQYSTVSDIISLGATEANSIVAAYSDFVNVVIPTSYATEALKSSFDFKPSSNSNLINEGEFFDNIFDGDFTDGLVDIGAIENGATVPDYGSDFTNVCERIDLSSRVWNGSQGIGWHHPDNWTPCGIPERITTTTVPTGLVNYPFLNSDAVAKSLFILGTGKVEITNEATLTMEGAQ